MSGSFPSLALAVSLSGLTLALAASCGGGGEIDNLPGTQGAAGSSSGGQAGTTAGSGGGAQQGASGTGGSGASGGAGGSGGGSAGNAAGGSAGGGSAGAAGNGGSSAGSAGNGGGSSGAAGAAGGAGICPPAELLPPPTCGQPPPPGLEACATCLCGNNACRSAYETCTALPGCSRIASCVFQCAAAGATDGVNACSSQGNLADQFAALAVLNACEVCESVCVTGTPP